VLLVRGQTGRVLLGVRILFRLFNLYGYVRVPVRAMFRVFVCDYLCVMLVDVGFIFLIYYLVILFFYVNSFYVSDF